WSARPAAADVRHARRGLAGRELLRGDAVVLDEFLVELPPEPGRRRQGEPALDEIRPVRDHPPPDRVAVRMEDLEIRAVRLAREEVRRDLGLLVVRQLDAVEVRGG